MKSLVALPILLLLLLLLPMLVGCGASRPTVNDATQAIQKRLAEWDHGFKLVSFRKTNGIASVENGVSHYKLEGECDVEFTKNGRWDGRFVNEVTTSGPPVNAGQRGKIPYEITFEKTENGWRSTGISVRCVNPLK